MRQDVYKFDLVLAFVTATVWTWATGDYSVSPVMDSSVQYVSGRLWSKNPQAYLICLVTSRSSSAVITVSEVRSASAILFPPYEMISS